MNGRHISRSISQKVHNAYVNIYSFHECSVVAFKKEQQNALCFYVIASNP